MTSALELITTPADRHFDLTVMGVTGFTGKLVVQYLDKLAKEGKLQGVRVCFAGRSGAALQTLIQQNAKHLAPGVCVADVARPASLFEMARNTHVVLALVGPYEALGGEHVIKACVDAKTHYVDITGEGRWVALMRQKYDQLAKQNGVCLVPLAGQDCVPADLVAWFATSQLPHGDFAHSHATLETMVRLPGGKDGQISNGTFKTLISQPGWSFELEQPRLDFQAKLSRDVHLVPEVSRQEAVFPMGFFPDFQVVRESHLVAHPPSGGGRFENTHNMVFPNRAAAYATKWTFAALPYMLNVPYARTLLGKLSANGERAIGRSSNAAKPTTYVNHAVLKMYPLEHAQGQHQPLETIVTRLDCDRDPYDVTAITCVQVALALLAQKKQDGADTAMIKPGFQTPVSAVGGQELLERCYECFRAKLVSRL